MARASRRPALRSGKTGIFEMPFTLNMAIQTLIPSNEEVSPGLKCAALEGLNC